MVFRLLSLLPYACKIQNNLWSLTIQEDPPSKQSQVDAMGQWKDFPFEIVKLIIAKLPIANIYRLQTMNTYMYELVKRCCKAIMHHFFLWNREDAKSFLSGQLIIPRKPIDVFGTPSMNHPLVFKPKTKTWDVKLPQLSSYLPFLRRGKFVIVFVGNGGLFLLG